MIRKTEKGENGGFREQIVFLLLQTFVIIQLSNQKFLASYIYYLIPSEQYNGESCAGINKFGQINFLEINMLSVDR